MNTTRQLIPLDSDERTIALLTRQSNIYAERRNTGLAINAIRQQNRPNLQFISAIELQPITTTYQEELSRSNRQDSQKTDNDSIITSRYRPGENSFLSTQAQNSPSRVLTKSKMQNAGKKHEMYRNWSYEVANLTLTLHNWREGKRIFVPLLLISAGVRVYSLLFLLFAFAVGIRDKEFLRWEWLMVLGITRFLFVLVVLNVSLSFAEDNLRKILKNCWNPSSGEITIHELFEKVTLRSFMKCLIKAVTPPELAFLYLLGQNKLRKMTLYITINYIYLSFETVIFYPFLILYCLFELSQDKDLLSYKIYTYLTIVITSSWVILFAGFSGFLLFRGILVKCQKIT